MKSFRGISRWVMKSFGTICVGSFKWGHEIYRAYRNGVMKSFELTFQVTIFYWGSKKIHSTPWLKHTNGRPFKID